MNLHKAKLRAKQAEAAMCAKTQQDNKLFLASDLHSKVIMKFVLSMPLFISYMHKISMIDTALRTKLSITYFNLGSLKPHVIMFLKTAGE